MLLAMPKCREEKGMNQKELKTKIICEIALHLLRKAVREGVISAAEYEKAARDFIESLA